MKFLFDPQLMCHAMGPLIPLTNHIRLRVRVLSAAIVLRICSVSHLCPLTGSALMPCAPHYHLSLDKHFSDIF